MYNKEQLEYALRRTGVMSDPIFKQFLDDISKLYPHQIYSSRSVDYVKELMLVEGVSDSVVSNAMLVLRDLRLHYPDTTNVHFLEVYATIYESSLLAPISDVAKSDLTDNPTVQLDIFYETLIMLAIHHAIPKPE